MNTFNLDLSCLTSDKENFYFKAIDHAVKNNKPLLALLPYKYTRNQYVIKLIITGTLNDLNSWLDLFLEHYPLTKLEVICFKERLTIKYLKETK